MTNVLRQLCLDVAAKAEALAKMCTGDEPAGGGLPLAHAIVECENALGLLRRIERRLDALGMTPGLFDRDEKSVPTPTQRSAARHSSAPARR
jgi:hypothetical protein